MPTRFTLPLLVGAVAIAVSGCSTTKLDPTADGDIVNQLKDENVSLKESLSRLESDLSSRDAQLREYEGRLSVGSDRGADLLPPQAKTGECYARVFVPPKYKPVSKTVLKSEASERVETDPAKYDYVEQQVLVKEATTELKVIPATYDWVTEDVLVKEASTVLKEVPAVYENQTERVLVREGYTTWKKGRGPIERIDDATGEIMCLVEVPPEYRTVTKRVLVTPARVEKVELPAEYSTVKKRVVVEPAKTATVDIPAEYKTVKVRKMVEPPKERRIEIPAEYQEVTDRELVAEGQLEWRPILCETNTTPGVIERIQQALANAGYNPGPMDGVIGSQTMSAVKSFQEANGLAVGQLTMETLRKLSVM